MRLRLHTSLRRGGFFVEHDVIVLDGEFMPWSFKAAQGERNLITQAFQIPGQVAQIDAHFKKDAARVQRAERFLRTLAVHSAEVTPAFVPFDVKLRGKVKSGQRWLDDPKLGMRTRAHMLRWLEECVEQSHAEGYPSLLQAAEWHPVYLENQHVDTGGHSIALWEAYCAAGGEGFVYKPMRPETLPDGAPVQPALKVRGRDYLRLIYGMNYLEPAFFEKVKRRNVAAKRRLALQENLLADRILRAFMRGERHEKDRYVAAFLGCDGVEGRSIDATL
jgi:protein phosphatase